MRLSEKEYYQYLRLHLGLMFYVGKRKGFLKKATTFEEFKDLSSEDKFPIRNAVYEHIELVDKYIRDHKDDLSKEDQEILAGFKYFRGGMFYVYKLLKKYAYFLNDDYVYGVLALSDPFERFWHPGNLPVAVQAVLLPFKDKIIYDGFVQSYPMVFGKNMRTTIKNDFDIKSGLYGVITTLPEHVKKLSKKELKKRELKAMMKSKSAIDYNWYDILGLLEEYPDLNPVYIHEMGRINARIPKKTIKELGIKKRHYAYYENAVIASHSSKKELEQEVKSLIKDKKKLAGVYYFKV